MTVVDTRGVHGAAVPKITAAQMRDQLISLDTVREALASTEPLTPVGFPVGEHVRFRVEPGWNHGIEATEGTAPVDAFVRIGGRNGTEFQLSKDAILEATSLCGLPKGYVTRSPAKLTTDALNYWFREGLAKKEFKLLAVGELGAAFTRHTMTPFSNVRLLEQAMDGIEQKYGKGDVLADYKFQHSLRKTHVRLIVPESTRLIPSAREDDNWSVGINLQNSLIGEEGTQFDGYMFAWWCTNGAIDLHNSSGSWSRRRGGQGDDVYEWARTAVDEILGGLEHSLDAVSELTTIPIEGEVNDVLRDVFEQNRVPVAARDAIIKNMVESGDLTAYGVMQAITAAANDPQFGPETVASLMQIGGTLPHKLSHRCGECRRMIG